MKAQSVNTILHSFLHPNEIVIEGKDHKSFLNVPLNKKLSIRLSNAKGELSQWLPTKNSIRQFSEINIQKQNKNLSVIELIPGTPGKGKIQLYCLDKSNHQKVLDFFQINYNILGE